MAATTTTRTSAKTTTAKATARRASARPTPTKTNGREVNIGIGKDARKEIAHGVSCLLADSYMLYVKTHSFHWNVEGPMFNTLHVMFMEQYTELWNALDIIAERIRALGHYAPSSYKSYSELTKIKESTKVPKAMDMVKELLLGHEIVAQTARDVLPAAEEANDQATLDLLTQRLNLHEKTAWMLRSLLAN